MNKNFPLKGLVPAEQVSALARPKLFSFKYKDILGYRQPNALAAAVIEEYIVTSLVSTLVTSTFIEALPFRELNLYFCYLSLSLI